MERYAFIDVSNTKGTTKTVHGFSIDWQKLFHLLKGAKWQCREIFYYEGAMNSKSHKKKHTKLASIGYRVVSKVTFLHKNREKRISFICETCNTTNSLIEFKTQCERCQLEKVLPLNDGGRHPKANFDVELTVDALEYAAPDKEYLVFTGDGDFAYLAERLINRGVQVTFVSSTQKTSDSHNRFSTRLKELIAREEIRAVEVGEKPRARIIEINDWKNIIAKT